MSRERAAVTALSKWQTLPPLLAAAIVRLTFLLIVLQRTGTSILTQGDTPAISLLVAISSTTEPSQPLSIHFCPRSTAPAGYPIFAVLTESLTGSFGGSIIPTILTQVLLSLVSLIILTRIASRTFPNTSAGTFAGWLFAFEPVSITYSLRIMPETLFLFLLLVAIERLLTYQRTASYAALFTSCLSLAAATYVRPVAYYLGFAIALALAITDRHKKGRHWRAPVLVLLTIYPLLFAWQIRNNIETGYHGFSSIVEKNLYFFQAAEITAEQRRIPLDQQQQQLGYVDQRHYDEAHPDQFTWTRAKQLQYMHTQATTILAAHPLLYLESHFKGVAVVALTPAASEPLQMLNAYPRDDSTPHRILNEGIFTSLYRLIQAHPTLTVTMAVFEIFLLLLYLFAIRGCFIPNANRLAILTLICFALYFLLISGGAQAVGRYRLPVMPELCVLAAGGLSYLANKKKSEAA